ncbi:hypothetical protein E2C01_045839 [Portunus trituberculatus]|uniref:Uncharacterized protein n=1 Tax=Portunus trituberculatus TaxID=210409 RepID=A0A5B7FWU9_PORTR|nr:hypothetical protein [Portunus trituberculatus]
MDVPQSAVPGHGQDDDDSNAESHQSNEDNAEKATVERAVRDLLLLLVVTRHTARLTLKYNNTLPQFHHTIAPGKSIFCSKMSFFRQVHIKSEILRIVSGRNKVKNLGFLGQNKLKSVHIDGQNRYLDWQTFPIRTDLPGQDYCQEQVIKTRSYMLLPYFPRLSVSSHQTLSP